MKRAFFILGIMFGISTLFISDFVFDLLALVYFPNEGIVPNPWSLGAGMIGTLGSVLIYKILPEDDALHAKGEGQ